MIELLVRQAGGPEDRLSFDSESLVVGRSRAADLHIPDSAMSRSHARLFEDDGKWFVEDLGSRNGTLLNGSPVHKRQRLSGGDVVLMGGSSLTVRRLPGEEAMTPESSAQKAVYTPARALEESSDVLPPVGTTEHDLRRALARLQILNEVHRALGRSVDLQELLGLILDRVFEHLAPEEAAIFLSNDDGAFERIAGRSTRGSDTPAVVSSHLLEEVAVKGMGALVLDASTDERFKDAASLLSAGVRSLVAAPLLSPEGSLGMIAVESMIRVRQFTEQDLELLVSLASIAALRIRNLRLAAAAIERARLGREMSLARQIQVALLPAALPELPGLEIVGRNVPSRVVSGDFYKAATRRRGDQLVLLVADVSGKGIAAALLTASLEALTAVPMASGAAPDEICTTASELLWNRTPAEKYATAFVAELDAARNDIRYCNAGHVSALLVHRHGDIEWLTSTGMPLGILPGATYRSRSATLAAGDLLVVYTDGISEAEDSGETQYGVERLADVCAGHHTEPLGAIALAIEHDLEQFAAGVPFEDDRTLLMVRRLEAGE